MAQNNQLDTATAANRKIGSFTTEIWFLYNHS